MTAQSSSDIENWDSFFETVEEAVSGFPTPSVNEIESGRSEPWDVLVSTIISLRTKDKVTLEASRRLLAIAPGPVELRRIDEETIAEAIYPAGFYRMKAANLRKIAAIIVADFNGVVPDGLPELLALPGVGLKTANLVLSVGFGIPAICVDIHVHRIANRRGWLNTTNPDASEAALRKVLPERWWIDINRLLVGFGQSVCTPTSPHCSSCPFTDNCRRVGVDRHR